MPAADRDDFPSVDFKSILVDQVDLPVWRSGIFVFCKCIGVFHTQGIFYIFLTIYVGGLLVMVVECADIVESSGMVLMVVGKQNGINA